MLFKLFQDPGCTKKFIFSKSKTLNENRIDRNFIYAPLDLPLAWFGLNTRRKKTYWIWKLAKISLFWAKYAKTQKSLPTFKKVKFSEWIKFSNNIFWVFERFFEPRGILRKRFGPIWMYIERFYELKKKRFLSNFIAFLKRHDRLRPEISSRVVQKCKS